MQIKIIFISLFGAFIFMHEPVKAQWSLGGEVGLQLNNIRVKGIGGGLIGRLPKSIISPFGRLTATYQTSDYLGFKTGVGYSQKGFQLAQGLNVNVFNLPIGIGAKVATEVDYIEVPIEGIYKVESGSRTYLISAGVNVAYAVRGKIQPKASIIIDINLPSVPLNLTDDIYNRHDVSGTVGLGMIQNTGNGNIVFQARYVRSFSNFLDNPVIGLKLKPYSYQISLGYHILLGQGRNMV